MSAQSTTSALLFTSASVNDDTTDVDYTSCSLEKPFVVQGSLLDDEQLSKISGKLFYICVHSGAAVTTRIRSVTKCTAVLTPAAKYGTSCHASRLMLCAVGARWFGGQTAQASDFSVKDCRVVTMTGGRSVEVYKNTKNSECRVHHDIQSKFCSDTFLAQHKECLAAGECLLCTCSLNGLCHSTLRFNT